MRQIVEARGCVNWFFAEAVGRARESWEALCCCVWCACGAGRGMWRLSSPGLAAPWRGSPPSSAARLWARIQPTCVELYLDEETAPTWEWIPSPGVDLTDWEMWMTERDGQLNSLIAPAGAVVSQLHTLAQKDFAWLCISVSMSVSVSWFHQVCMWWVRLGMNLLILIIIIWQRQYERSD